MLKGTLKKFLYLFIMILLVLQSVCLFSCKEKNEELLFVCPDGAPALSIANFISENNNFNIDGKINYKVVSANNISNYMINASGDIIILPVNAGSKLYNKQEDNYKMVSVLTHGNLYIVSKSEITLSDLSNKQVAVIGQGLVPDLTFKAVLKKHNIQNVEFNYFSSASDVIPQLKKNIISIALLPEPAVTNLKKVDNSGSYYTLDLQSLYDENTKCYPQAVMMIKESVIKKYPNLVSEIKNSFDNSLTYIKNNTSSAIEVISGAIEEGVVPSLNSNITATTIDNCHIFWQDGDEARESIVDYINSIREIDEKSANSDLSGFFYEK